MSGKCFRITPKKAFIGTYPFSHIDFLKPLQYALLCSLFVCPVLQYYAASTGGTKDNPAQEVWFCETKSQWNRSQVLKEGWLPMPRRCSTLFQPCHTHGVGMVHGDAPLGLLLSCLEFINLWIKVHQQKGEWDSQCRGLIYFNPALLLP